MKWWKNKDKVKFRTKKFFRLRALIKCQKIQAMLRFLKTSATSPYKSVSADTVLDDRLYHKQEKKLSQHYYKSFTKCVIILQQHFHHQNNLFWKERIFSARKFKFSLPAIKSTTSVCVDCVTWVPLTLTMTSFSRIPDRSAAPPGRTVCTETGRSPDNVKPNPDCSSRLTISVLVLSVVDEGELDDALDCLLLKLEWKEF